MNEELLRWSELERLKRDYPAVGGLLASWANVRTMLRKRCYDIDAVLPVDPMDILIECGLWRRTPASDQDTVTPIRQGPFSLVWMRIVSPLQVERVPTISSAAKARLPLKTDDPPILKDGVTMPGGNLLLFVSLMDEKIKVMLVQLMLVVMDQLGIDCGLVLSHLGATPPTENTLCLPEYGRRIVVQRFAEKMIDLPRHRLVPRALVACHNEHPALRRLQASHKLNDLRKLPRILTYDPIVQYHNWPPGTVISFVNEEHQAPYVQWAIVADQ